MKRIFGWLESKLSRSKSLDFSDPPGESGSAKPDEIDLGVDLPKELRDLVNDVPIPDVDLAKYVQETVKIAPMPDIYADEHVDTVPDVDLVDPTGADTDTSPGFNPYDTVKMHKK